MEQMKQLTSQLKKHKDGAAQKVAGLEKRIVDTMNSIQVQQLISAVMMSVAMFENFSSPAKDATYCVESSVYCVS